MLRNTKRNSARPALKLFPRLAIARAVPPPLKLEPPLVAGGDKTMRTRSKREAEAMRVRARLLQMIVDNERARRHDWRPNAS